jgi:hypothetical protein
VNRFADKWMSFEETGLQAAYTRDSNSVSETDPNPGDGYEFQATYIYNAAGQRVLAVEHKPRNEPENPSSATLVRRSRASGGLGS